MGLTINTNVSSLNAQRNLNKSSGALSTSMERLSSGLRINSAKDDAAGLAISDRMTSQVKGLNQAARNANDGISLAQTAEGALQESTNILQRIRELAVQSANDTNTGSDRASLNDEVQQLKDELSRIAETTQFNGKSVIDGTMEDATFQVGANAGAPQTISFSIDSAKAADLSQVGTTIEAPAGKPERGTTLTGSVAANTIQVNGNDVGAATNNRELATAINAADETVTAKAVNFQEFDFNEIQLDLQEKGGPVVGLDMPASTNAIAADSMQINDVDVGYTAAAGKADAYDLMVAIETNDEVKDLVETTATNEHTIAFTNVTFAATGTDTAYEVTLSAGGETTVYSFANDEVGDTTAAGTNITASAVVDAINAEDDGFSAELDGASIVITQADGKNFDIKESATTATMTSDGLGVVTGGSTVAIGAAATTLSGQISLDVTGAEDVTLAGDELVDLGLAAGVTKGPGEAKVGGADEVLSPLNTGDLVINGNDVGAVAGDAAAMAEAIQIADPAVLATAKNTQEITFGSVTLGSGSYTLQLDGKEVAIDANVDSDTATVSNEDIIAAINAVDGFSAKETLGDSTKIDITKAGGDNFTINEILDTVTSGIGFEDDKADGRDLRGTISLESQTSIVIGGTDPTKAGLELGRTDPKVDGEYKLTLTKDDGGTIAVNLDSAMRDGIVDAEEVATAINADVNATEDFAAAVTESGKLEIGRRDGSDFKITEYSDKDGSSADDANINDGIVGVKNEAKNFVGQVEIDSTVDVTLTGVGLEQAGLANVGNATTTIDKVDILTRESAVTAITSVDEALMDIDNIRGGLGAVQNRFSSTINNLNNVSENLSAARSRILDTDIAAETSEMTKQNVLQQAGVSILAQANQAPQMALSLIG